MNPITTLAPDSLALLATMSDMPRRQKLPQTTLGEVAYLNLKPEVGVVRAAVVAARVGSSLLAMAQTAEKLGHWPTRAEYAAEWRMSERQVTRDWGAIREALHVEPNDPQLADWLLARRAERRLDNPKQLEALEAPTWLLAA